MDNASIAGVNKMQVKQLGIYMSHHFIILQASRVCSTKVVLQAQTRSTDSAASWSAINPFTARGITALILRYIRNLPVGMMGAFYRI